MDLPTGATTYIEIYRVDPAAGLAAQGGVVSPRLTGSRRQEHNGHSTASRALQETAAAQHQNRGSVHCVVPRRHILVRLWLHHTNRRMRALCPDCSKHWETSPFWNQLAERTIVAFGRGWPWRGRRGRQSALRKHEQPPPRRDVSRASLRSNGQQTPPRSDLTWVEAGWPWKIEKGSIRGACGRDWQWTSQLEEQCTWASRCS